MKLKYIASAFATAMMLTLTSCGDDVEKYDNWPDWKVPSDLTVNGTPLDEVRYDNFVGKTIHLEHNQEVEFSDINDISGILNEDMWEPISALKARFTGVTGDYDLNYDVQAKLLYAELTDASFPDGLWISGRGYAHPQSTAVKGNESPGGAPDNMPFIGADPDRRGVYHTHLYLGSNFRFKFYKQRGDGDCIVYKDPELGIESRNVLVMAGNSSGDFCAGPLFTPGVYDITLDIPAGKCILASDNSEIELPVFIINDQELGVLGEVTTMLGINLDLKNGDSLTFKGFDDIRNLVPAGMLDATSATDATFTGNDGNYDIYYDIKTKFIYVENAGLSYPDALWLCGEGFGHPAATAVTAQGWSFDQPSDAFQMKKVADDIYEVCAYLGSDFKFKMYPKHGWGEEITAIETDPLPVDMLGKAWVKEGYGGYFSGDFAPASGFRPGTYRIRVDVKNHTCTFADHTAHQGPVVFKVNGTTMTQDDQKAFISCMVDLTNGQNVTFDGFSNLDCMLQPSYFEKVDGRTYKFIGVTQKYKILYSPVRELIYCKIEGKDWTERYYPNCLWITGVGIGHPMTCNHTGDNLSSWNFDDPRDYAMAMPTADGVYECDVYLDNGFMLRYYYGHTDWGHTFDAKHVDTVPEYWCHWAGKDIKSENFGPGEGFTAGTYHLKLDTNAMVLTYTPL